MSKKSNKKKRKQESHKIVIIGRTGYPVRTIESSSYSIVGDTLLWMDFSGNQKAYKLSDGEEIDVLTMSI
jgi:hypothetical protein